MNQFKSMLIKLSAGVALTASGVVVANSLNSAHVQAATTSRIAISKKKGAEIWTNYQAGTDTGKKAYYRAKYKVIGKATDDQGRKWYAIGYKQWILASNTKKIKKVADSDGSYSISVPDFDISDEMSSSSTTSNSTSSKKNTYTSSLSSSEESAKAWIAMHESSNSYTARNGKYIGKYQLDSSYLNGDYSASNQERVADNYVKSRYGSWANAKKFWEKNNWY